MENKKVDLSQIQLCLVVLNAAVWGVTYLVPKLFPNYYYMGVFEFITWGLAGVMSGFGQWRYLHHLAPRAGWLLLVSAIGSIPAAILVWFGWQNQASSATDLAQACIWGVLLCTFPGVIGSIVMGTLIGRIAIWLSGLRGSVSNT